MSDRLEFDQHDELADALRIEMAQVTRSVADIGLSRSDLLASMAASGVQVAQAGVTLANKMVISGCIVAALAAGFVLGRVTAPSARTPMETPATPPVAAIDAAIVASASVDAAVLAPPVEAVPTRSGERPSPAKQPKKDSRYSALDEPLLIEQARAALRRGLANEAQRALAAHTMRFPTGQMVEERMLLSIEAAIQLDADPTKIRGLISQYRSRFAHGSLSARVNQLEAMLNAVSLEP